MARPQDSSLLGTLQSLYRQLVNQITLNRMKSYRAGPRPAGRRKLAQQLNDYITHVPAPTPAPPPAQPGSAARSDPGSPLNKISSPAPSTTDSSLPHQIMDSYKHLNSSYNSAGEKLMQSTLDHLHASIRHARSGNKEAAILHAGFMDSSLKEAAHYLSEGAYQAFVDSLKGELVALTEPVNQNRD